MSDLNKLKEASKEYLSTLTAHRKDPRSYAAVDAWDKASSDFAELTENNTLDIIASLINQLETAEAELARRDEAGGEPAFYIAASDIDNLKRAHVVEAAISKVKRFDEIPVFTAAQPSALPPEKVVDEKQFASALNALNDCLLDCGDSEQGLRLAFMAADIKWKEAE